jgi:hypothetical protein
MSEVGGAVRDQTRGVLHLARCGDPRREAPSAGQAGRFRTSDRMTAAGAGSVGGYGRIAVHCGATRRRQSGVLQRIGSLDDFGYDVDRCDNHSDDAGE